MSDLRVFGDWGSTRLRLWLLRDGEVVDQRDGPGIIGLERAAAAVLLSAIQPWREREQIGRIVLCGMAGARGGLFEAPYAECPVTREEWVGAAARFMLDGVPVRIAAGCANGVVDVMRGEETQAFGVFMLCPDFAQEEQCLVLPGTHSKWLLVRGGMILSLRTFLTGELFALLQSSSLLAASAAADEDADDGFIEGVSASERSLGLLGGLFATRAGQLRQGRSSAWAREFLSGLLIGAEMSEMRVAKSLPGSVTLIGDAKLTARYRHAFEMFAVTFNVLEGEKCALAGLQVLDKAN
jgi:2-dehydro-3-deoxygalactonokinase